MENIKNAIIKFIRKRRESNYIWLRVPKKFENQKKYLNFRKKTLKFIDTNTNYDK